MRNYFRGESVTSDPDFVPTSQLGIGDRSWRTEVRQALRTTAAVRQFVGLENEAPATPERAFATFVPRPWARRIRRGDPDDPLLRQVLVDAREGDSVDGFVTDPVGDECSSVGGGLLHKYTGRALLITTAACGIHCRYCFRREFPYSQHASRGSGYRSALAQIRRDDSIREILLSGGDPLMLDDNSLGQLTDQLAGIDHLRRIRYHTRMPVAIPSRITDAWIKMVTASRLRHWVVIHANHPAEFDAEVCAALGRIIDAGIPVLNQAVLLAGVNDRFDVLRDLCELLIDVGVQPYYLHQLDRATGTAHFEVSVETGKHLMSQLREVLPGYAVPQYVAEIPAQKHKTPLG
ncbi:MAG: KamA family radical SAM protein [Planctomycetota bacterium]